MICTITSWSQVERGGSSMYSDAVWCPLSEDDELIYESRHVIHTLYFLLPCHLCIPFRTSSLKPVLLTLALKKKTSHQRA